MRIILASGSPRRKELLSTLIKDFEIIVSDFEETIDSSKPLEEEIKRLAYGKAKSVFTNNQDALVIGSDTIVTIDNKVLGKPKTFEHAIEMLKELSGKKHKVITGVCIYTKDKVDTFAVVSDVYFDELTDSVIKKLKSIYFDYCNENCEKEMKVSIGYYYDGFDDFKRTLSEKSGLTFETKDY